MTSFALESLPPAPARVLEIGAGEGELARALESSGYSVLAIDPASSSEHVRRVALHDLDEATASFDAAVAVVSLHHVDPLAESCRRLAELMRPGAILVLDEIDVERMDERAARWFLDHRAPGDHDPVTPAEVVATLRHHCHDVSVMQDALEEFFEVSRLTRGPYLYRWALRLELRDAEEGLIAARELPAVGVRMVATRNPGRA